MPKSCDPFGRSGVYSRLTVTSRFAIESRWSSSQNATKLAAMTAKKGKGYLTNRVFHSVSGENAV